MKREWLFQGELRRSVARTDGLEIHKMYDAQIPGTEIAMEKPFDFMGVFNGTPLAIETKADDVSMGSFHYSCLESHQIEWLTKYERAGALAMILHNRRYGAGKARVNVAFAITMREFRQHGSHIKIERLMQLPRMEYWPKEKFWPIGKLLLEVECLREKEGRG